MIVVMTSCGSTPALHAQEIVAATVDTELEYSLCLNQAAICDEEDGYIRFSDLIEHSYAEEQPVSHSIVLEILPGRDCPMEPG